MSVVQNVNTEVKYILLITVQIQDFKALSTQGLKIIVNLRHTYISNSCTIIMESTTSVSCTVSSFTEISSSIKVMCVQHYDHYDLNFDR